MTDVVSVQNRYNFGDRESEAIVDTCERDGMAFLPWAPIHDISDKQLAPDRRRDITWMRGRSCWRGSWPDRPRCLPIPGTGSVAHLESNVAAAGLHIDPNELASLHRDAVISDGDLGRDPLAARRSPVPRRGAPAERLERILEAGRRSPSSSNWQPWDFVVVTDREALTELAKVWKRARHVAQSAATIALVAAVPEDEQRRDAPPVRPRAGDRIHDARGRRSRDRIRPLGGRRSSRRRNACSGFRTAGSARTSSRSGYPSDRPLRPIARPDRRPFDDVVHWDAW